MHMMPDFDEIDKELEDDEDNIVETDQRGKSIRNNQSSISFPPKVKKPKTKSPMDTFFAPNPDVVVQNREKQTKIDANDPYKKELRDRAVTRFTSYHETRVTYLKKELAHTNDLIKDHRENWVKYGCSIMADGWTDGKGRILINFVVNCPKGSMFIESIDASSYSKDGQKLFELLDKYVELVGEANVVQIVTDNASTNILAVPLIRVLRLVDIEKKTPMGYIYEAMDRAKESIASLFGGKEEKYEDIFKIIDHRWDVQLHRPLHAAAYFLNPEFFYANPNVAQDGEIHSKKRNSLEQNRLNDLVFIKYNRALKRRYDIRDTIDPISLSNINESNEWLRRRLDGESDEDEELVFENDTLTWGAVARASGVGESSKQTRATTSRVRSKDSTSTSNTIHLMDEEEAGSEETEEDAEGYRSGDEDEDVDLLVVDVEDDF
ncbi:hAT dimerization domain-containing protein [Actinidia rufa]|uniref:HAT dimerization domain-containing protein n=1 Tax=Actinidia rufa TaxID=165716 RepID=A0A7J0FG09_9ERIC|nr:hAT dimerization domain-containing protein [Actinidia rufa]